MDIDCHEYTTSWNRMYNQHIDNNDTCAVVTNYDDYASIYERDCNTLGFSLPSVVTKLLMDHMPANSFESETSLLLDVAAGTGLMGENLKRSGFKGFIDGVDGSQEMMNKAQGKNIYRKLTKVFLSPDTPMPIPNESYDVLTCIAALSQAHVRPELLNEFCRVAKPGALVVFTVRNNATNQHYIEQLNSIADTMEENGAWAKVIVFKAVQYEMDMVSSTDGKKAPMYSLVYCYRKI